MDENSDVHMETDVSSTTDDVVDTQEVTGSNGQVEMTITVEKVDEGEATSNMENDALIEICNNVSSGTTTGEKSPLKEPLSPTFTQKSPNKSNELEKSVPKSLVNTETPLRVTTIVTHLKNTVNMSAIEPKAESVDSSTKTDCVVSPNKDKICTKNKLNTDHNVASTAVEQGIKPFIIFKKTGPEIRSVSTIKDSGEQKLQSSSQILKSPANEKPVENTSVKKSEEQNRTFQVIQSNRSPSIKSPPIKLIRKPNKDFRLHDSTVKELKFHDTNQEEKLQDSTKPSTSKDKPTLETSNVKGNTTSPKPSKKEEITPDLLSLPCTDVPMDVVEAEVSNDSQLSSTASEKDHNKSISRELRSLINSAKESKIISECTQLTSKTRKSRTNLDASLNVSVEAEMVHDDRRDTHASDSDKPSIKRSMRSQNPDFVTKCKQFLSSVTSKVMKDSDETQSDSESEESKQKPDHRIEPANSTDSSPKKKKLNETVVDKSQSNMLRSDPYCWRCHWLLEADVNERQPMHPPQSCTVCVRSYHSKCMTVVERKISPEKNWVCPDCLQILHAESSETRSPSMKRFSLGMLCDLLKFALERMEALNGVEPFLHPVDRNEFPDYDKVIVHPVDLSLIRQNITDGHYGSTEAFIADAQWILHNSILFNACEQTFTQSKLTAAARALVRTCRAEMAEIETCPECYAGAHSRNLTYFTEVCSTPHMILWAKLKGFPYWPAKAVAINNGMVDVRFFGQHDKSWVPVRDCYLYSEKDPNTTKHKKQELIQCRQEAEVHIRNICRKYGSFVYAPFKTIFDQNKLTEQLKMMIPSFDGEIKAVNDKKASPVSKDKRRSTSKSSKGSFYDGDVSECEEGFIKSSTSLQKFGDDDNASKEDPKAKPEPDTSVSEKYKTMKVEVSLTKEPETPSRKRRRSTFPESSLVESTAEKRKKFEEKPEVTTRKPEPNSSREDKKPEPGSSKEVKRPEPASSKEDKRPEPGFSKDDKRLEPGSSKGDKRPEAGSSKDNKSPTLSSSKDDNKPELGSSKEDKNDSVKGLEAEVAELTKKASKPKEITKETDKVQNENDRSISLKEQEILRVTPIKLVALPRANKQTPKIFTTAKVTKSTPSTPTTPISPSTLVEEEKSLNISSSSSKRSKVTKADKFIMTEQKDLKAKSSRRNSRSNKSLTSSSKHEKTDRNTDKKSDSGSDASTSRERSKKKDDSDRSLLRKEGDTSKYIKDEKDLRKKTDDDLSLAAIARGNKNTNPKSTFSITGLPTISNVVSLSTVASKTNTTNTKITSRKNTPKPVEITVEVNPDSSIFTPTSSSNNMQEAVSKLQKLRNETTAESFVGRVGVKAFARMTSPDINDDVQVEVKTEPIDIDEIDENRQMEKMDLMKACKLQPVNQSNSLRDVRINKVVITPSVMVKKPSKPEPRPRAKKTFPQPKRPEGSELNGKNSMVYIPIQPPITQPPMKPKTTQHGITMPASVSAGPRPSAPVISTNSVNTVTTPLRPITSTLASPPQLNPLTAANPVTQVSTISQAPTVGPTTVHTVPLMTSVNGQWMFSLQPVMSVGGVDNASSPPMVNGIAERPGTTLVPISSSNAISNPSLPLTPVTNRNQQNANPSPALNDSNGTPLEMPRLMQRPLMSPFDANTPIGNLPPPSTAGPLTAKLNQNAVKLTDFFRTLLEDSIEKLDEPLAQVTALKIQLEQARWRHQQSLDELKHNNDLTLSEMRQSFEKEKQRVVSETRRAAQVELEAAVKLTKSKQWCSNCYQEAQFYCCWNTSYCDYTCQRAHWNTHHIHCTQEKSFQPSTQNKIPEQRSRDQQPQPIRKTISEPRSLEQQPMLSPTNKIIIENAEKRIRALTNKQPPPVHKITDPSEPRSWEQMQQPLLSPTNKNVVDNVEPRVRAITNTQQQREDSVQAQREKLQIILNNAKQRDELRRQKDATESRLHQGDNPPKSVPSQTPCLTTIGGKPAPMRVFTDPTGTQKTSIIVSMIEDTSGNQTLKCVGTYKAPAQATTQISPLLINQKQTNDDSGASKKTVTSGGYLIVGASGNTASVITPASTRRPHAQYFS